MAMEIDVKGKLDVDNINSLKSEVEEKLAHNKEESIKLKGIETDNIDLAGLQYLIYCQGLQQSTHRPIEFDIQLTEKQKKIIDKTGFNEAMINISKENSIEKPH